VSVVSPAESTGRRPLRILFVVQHGALLRFSLLIPALAARGHEIRIVFPRGGDWRQRRFHQHKGLLKNLAPQRTEELLRELEGAYPGAIKHGKAPLRDPTGAWSSLAWLNRGLADLAHNADPRYRNARVLRLRTSKRILRQMGRPGEFEPVARIIAHRIGRQIAKRVNRELSHRWLRATRLVEDAVPASKDVTRFLRKVKPDIVLTTGTFRHVSGEVDYLKSARKLGIPSGIFVTSWDNLTNKGSLKYAPELVFVWNEIQARDAVELHKIPADRVRVTGAHVFDEWFGRQPTRNREQLLSELDLDPTKPYVVYLCSSGNIAHNEEPQFIQRWLTALRSSDDPRLREMNVIVRPHPNVRNRPTDLGFENVAVWPPRGAYPVAEQARDDFVDTLTHCSAVVGMNTTAMIEAAVRGKSVMTVLVPEFAQDTTLHFHYLLAENGGFLHVANDLDEHVRQLGSVLDEDEEGEKLRRAFVESFVRPRGIDRPAAPIAAEAIEELADQPVQSRVPPRILALRAALSVEAALNVLHELYLRVRERFRSDPIVPLEPTEEAPAMPAEPAPLEQAEVSRR
jgi:hypothetical protein